VSFTYCVWTGWADVSVNRFRFWIKSNSASLVQVILANVVVGEAISMISLDYLNVRVAFDESTITVLILHSTEEAGTHLESTDPSRGAHKVTAHFAPFVSDPGYG